jgi:nitroimidazol reductase NimA-like FMN-containing flavoprotein (pyridoxamine 5'-phosphate oxidase superfamily)
MEQVANRQRECRDRQRIEQFLTDQRVGLLGLRAPDYPYVVPVNYVWHDGAVVFHGRGSGKKYGLVTRDPTATFVVVRHDGTVPAPAPCQVGTAYFSVMLFGRVERFTDHEAAADGLRHLVDAHVPGRHRGEVTARLVRSYHSDRDENPMAVYRLVPEHITAKERPDPLTSAGTPRTR